jgi:hypothetical protein
MYVGDHSGRSIQPATLGEVSLLLLSVASTVANTCAWFPEVVFAAIRINSPTWVGGDRHGHVALLAELKELLSSV